jgi:ARG/rhodanese/phosphatase superfamily protein
MLTLADVGPIAKTLGNILTGEPRSHGALTMVPLLAPMLSEPDWLTLAEDDAGVRITEVSEAGSVPNLTVTNLADRPLLLLDGEQLLGAKQNRILNTTVLIAANATVTVPVSCVEQGRWGYRERHFTPSDVSLFASVRRAKADSVTRSARAGRGHVADQGGVWDALAARTAEHAVPSPTGAMHDFFAHYAADIDATRTALAPVPGQIGAVVYLEGRWAGLELLAGPGLFARAWPRLCAGYAGDSIGRKAARRRVPSSATVLANLAACPTETVSAVGLGAEYRLTGEKLAGAGLVVDDQVAQLMAFPRATTDRAHR